MNKQELIERIEDFPCEASLITEMIRINKNILLGWVKELDEPQKPVVPQFVADWIEESRLKGWDLLASMCFVLNAKNKKTTKWFYLGENKNIFALAWINGYTVEKEKRYSVKIKGEIEENLLVYGSGINRYFFARTYDSSKRNEHTRKELEKAGFGWVFDCEGIELEEVE